ncbi:hypothetical protein EHQ94_10870 [Leptospira meyeri]|uniref:hypothetical protein n=1 Tax=Leptospira meyeri TaxID=29508 RepID=UPI00108232C9|nr:hypothetical protein [Leptospira meyeri]TGM58490.1 hypothetical protein EHQ93_19700 [Leptospira meyeri]TGM66496.1 hypothetical protein EHQ94_10870 [Leptospira meyeri]
MKKERFYIPLALIIFFANFYKLFTQNKNEIIDFSKYEIKESFYLDCPEKKKCFNECSNSGSAMPNRKYDQFNTNDQVLRNECTRKCSEIICTKSNK